MHLNSAQCALGGDVSCTLHFHGVWSLPAVQGEQTCFSITLCSLLLSSRRSQVSSPGAGLTAEAGRVVTVMHGYTASRVATWGEEEGEGGREMRGGSRKGGMRRQSER